VDKNKNIQKLPPYISTPYENFLPKDEIRIRNEEIHTEGRGKVKDIRKKKRTNKMEIHSLEESQLSQRY
jgi:hypothetical protein